jgi:putative membrane protein insertion efficiency factor
MRQLAVIAIKIYQRGISPFIPPSCRFYPSCSEYAHQAIEKYGLLKGSVLAVTRIAHCHPWNAGGVDPVP